MFNAIKITAPFDVNGNSRRGWDVFSGTEYIGFVAEDAAGNRALLNVLGLNNFSQVWTLMEYPVSASVYNAKTRGPRVQRITDNLDAVGNPVRIDLATEGANRVTGTWLDSHRGWTMSAEVVRIAWRYGMPHTDHDELIVDAYEAGKETVKVGTGRDAETVDTGDAMISQGSMVDAAEAWLNVHIAPAGYWFSFDADLGDWGLWAEENEDEGDDEGNHPVKYRGQATV